MLGELSYFSILEIAAIGKYSLSKVHCYIPLSRINNEVYVFGEYLKNMK